MIKPLFQKIVVAYHNTQAAKNALLYAILMAKVYKCQVKVVVVIDTASIKLLTISKFMTPEEGDRLAKNLESDSKKNVDYAVSLAKAKNVKIETEVRSGAVWSEIVSAADEFGANLILLGAPLEGESKATSVCNMEILSHAGCSVLFVRQKHLEQLYKLA